MGNIYAESELSSTNLQNSFEKKLGYTDASYTSGVDAGTYTNFVRDSAGYGLCQWTYWSRKQALLEFCHSKGTSIGDLEMQLEFMYKELSENYGTVMSVLRSATTVLQASNSVLLQYERPADQSSAVQSNTIKEDVDELKEAKEDTNNSVDKINDSIAMLIESDKESIKAYVTERHHFFVYEHGWIDDYSMECLERRFLIYQHEHGNSFVEGLMDEIRALPKQPPEQYKHKFDGTATYVKNAKAKTKH